MKIKFIRGRLSSSANLATFSEMWRKLSGTHSDLEGIVQSSFERRLVNGVWSIHSNSDGEATTKW